jgi:precorrin-8X/cobalt-precorrin-8 methylmutase
MDKGKIIEDESFKIIEKNLNLEGLSEEKRLLITKLAHATGDIDFTKTIVFSDSAIKKGIVALKKGSTIVCDVMMVKSGITKRYNKKTKVYCFINDQSIIDIAGLTNQTRAEVSIEAASIKFNDCLYVIGNAPTALMKLIELYEKGKVNPSLVVAFPVGFVSAEEAKERLIKTDLPFITNRGTKGGSAAAATVCNALLYLANFSHFNINDNDIDIV